jgi:uncharacterized membrane protein YqaE (UPF0057 family)
MLSILSIVCPPLAVLWASNSWEALKNLGLTLLFYIPGVIHAHAVVERYQANRQYDILMRLLESRKPARSHAV